MRTTWVAITALVGLVPACGGDSGRFFIVQNQVPQAGCVVTTQRDIYRGEGILDASLAPLAGQWAYVLFPLIQNNYPNASGMGAPEPNRLFVRAFRVVVEPGAGAPQAVLNVFGNLSNANPALLQFQEPWAASLDPGGGLVAASVGVVPAELVRQIQGTGVLSTMDTIPLTVRVRAVGQRSLGDVESDEFVYPIEVCQNCLVGTVAACPFKAANPGNACNVAQDAVVDCCTTSGMLTCPAQAAQ